MKIFNWMQCKLNGRQGIKKSTPPLQNKHILQEPKKEEFSDWPHALLAIGTFGNNDIKEEPKTSNSQEKQSLSEDQLDFTPEEVGKLEKELTKLLSRKPVELEREKCKDLSTLPLDKFLNCPSSLEVDRRLCHTVIEDLDETYAELHHSASVILSKGKDVSLDNNSVMHKRSLSFLLKKMFVCSSGFAPSPSIRNQMPESRIEKLLRAILHKKIRPQTSNASSMAKKYLESRPSIRSNAEDQMEERRDSSSKWVKTDTEYIVLEI